MGQTFNRIIEDHIYLYGFGREFNFADCTGMTRLEIFNDTMSWLFKNCDDEAKKEEDDRKIYDSPCYKSFIREANILSIEDKIPIIDKLFIMYSSLEISSLFIDLFPAILTEILRTRCPMTLPPIAIHSYMPGKLKKLVRILKSLYILTDSSWTFDGLRHTLINYEHYVSRFDIEFKLIINHSRIKLPDILAPLGLEHTHYSLTAGIESTLWNIGDIVLDLIDKFNGNIRNFDTGTRFFSDELINIHEIYIQAPLIMNIIKTYLSLKSVMKCEIPPYVILYYLYNKDIIDMFIKIHTHLRDRRA
jgi:hypothetical protein